MPYAPTPYARGGYEAEKWHQKLMRSWAGKGAFNAIAWLGDTLNRLNVSKNSLLLGDFENAFLSLIPFGETMGLDIEKVTGAQVFKRWGIAAGGKVNIPFLGRKSTRDILGFAMLDVLGDPLMWLGGPGLTKVGVQAQKRVAAVLQKVTAGKIGTKAAYVAMGRIMPTSWAAQAAMPQAQRALLRFGITSGRSIPLIRGGRALGQLQKWGQAIKVSAVGQKFAHGYADAAVDYMARIAKAKDLGAVMKIRGALGEVGDALFKLPPAERHLVARAMEEIPSLTRAPLPGFAKYPQHIQQLAEMGRGYIDELTAFGRARGVAVPEFGAPLAREVAAFAKAREVTVGVGEVARAAYAKRVQPLIDVLDYRFKEIATKGDEAGRLLDNLRGLKELQAPPGKFLKGLRNLSTQYLDDPNRVFQPEQFRAMLKKMGVTLSPKWTSKKTPVGQALWKLTQVAEADKALQASQHFYETIGRSKEMMIGYVPRALAPTARAAYAEAREKVVAALTTGPDSFLSRSVTEFNTAFKDIPGINPRELAKVIGDAPPTDEFFYWMSRNFLDKKTGEMLSIGDATKALEKAGRETADEAMTRTRAFGLALKKRYGWLERATDKITTGKTRVVPALYGIETAPAQALSRMADGIIDGVFGKRFTNLAAELPDQVSDVIRANWLPGKGLGLTGKWVHPHLAVDLKKMVLRFRDRKQVGRVMGFAWDLENIWKRSILGPFLAYQTRNMLTDTINDFFTTGNADLTTFTRVLAARANPNRSIRVGTKTMKAGEFLKMTAAADVGATFVKGEIMRDMKTTSLRAVQKLFGDTPLARHLRRINPLSQDFFITAIGKGRDEVHRMASFLHGLDTGLDPITAALRTKAAFFDYSRRGLTEFEQGIKHFFPFYTFFRNNIALQTEFLFTKPYKIALQLKAIPDLHEAEIGEERALLPPAIREGLVFYGGKRGDVHTFIKGIGLPIEDAAELLSWSSGINRAMLKMFSRTSPLIKLPLEWMFDTNTFFGTKISEYDRAFSILRHAPGPIKNYLGFKEVKTKKGLRWRMDPWKVWLLGQVRAFTLAGRVLESIDDPTQRSRMEAFMWAATGIRPMRYDMEQLRMRGERALVEKMTREFRRKGEVGVFTLPYIPKDVDASAEARAVVELFRRRRRR